MADFNVTVDFNGYIFPYVQQISDPQEGMKATVIKGNRADGSIVIPGGKKSQQIRVRGKIFDNDGYADITSQMNTMRSSVTTAQGTLTLKHNGLTDWSYTIRRIDEIRFPQSMRTGIQEYEVTFLVLAYS